MIDIFTAFCDILVYPMYHILDDSYMGILFYLLLLYWVAFMLSDFVLGLPSFRYFKRRH